MIASLQEEVRVLTVKNEELGQETVGIRNDNSRLKHQITVEKRQHEEAMEKQRHEHEIEMILQREDLERYRKQQEDQLRRDHELEVYQLQRQIADATSQLHTEQSKSESLRKKLAVMQAEYDLIASLLSHLNLGNEEADEAHPQSKKDPKDAIEEIKNRMAELNNRVLALTMGLESRQRKLESFEQLLAGYRNFSEKLGMEDMSVLADGMGSLSDDQQALARRIQYLRSGLDNQAEELRRTKEYLKSMHMKIVDLDTSVVTKEVLLINDRKRLLETANVNEKLLIERDAHIRAERAKSKGKDLDVIKRRSILF